MNSTNVEYILDRFEQCAREWLNVFNRNTCIEQTRILVEVLARFGVHAEPMATKLHVICERCGFQYLAGIDAGDIAKARSMELAIEGWPGVNLGSHTVALVERRWLVDLTLSQASQEGYGFILNPQMNYIDLGGELPEGDLPHVKVQGESDNDIPCSVEWIATPQRDWEATAAWEPSHLWGIIDAIEARMLGHEVVALLQGIEL